jgi:hypothetical protein
VGHSPVDTRSRHPATPHKRKMRRPQDSFVPSGNAFYKVGLGRFEPKATEDGVATAGPLPTSRLSGLGRSKAKPENPETTWISCAESFRWFRSESRFFPFVQPKRRAGRAPNVRAPGNSDRPRRHSFAHVGCDDFVIGLPIRRLHRKCIEFLRRNVQILTVQPQGNESTRKCCSLIAIFESL